MPFERLGGGPRYRLGLGRPNRALTHLADSRDGRNVQICATVCVLLSVADRRRLEMIASDRNQPRKFVERAHAQPERANRTVQEVFEQERWRRGSPQQSEA